MQTSTAIINGREVEVVPGKTILETASEHHITIPTLCRYSGKSMGNCGICVVEDKVADGLILSCSTPLEPGMEIRTESPRVVQARRDALTRLVNIGEHNCFIMDMPPSRWVDFQNRVMSSPWHQSLCQAWGHCELQDLIVKYGLNDEEICPREADFPLDDQHPMFVRDYSRCILCGRCIQACNEIQVNSAIPMPEGWNEETADPAYPLVNYDLCVHCGECVQACPTGALFEKKAYDLSNGHDTKLVRTTCPYCGVGCQLWLHVKDDRITRVTGVEHGSPNLGRLCVKGRFGYDFIYSEERLTTPLIRENGDLREASWDEALDLVAGKIREAIDQAGPDSVAGVSCARSINEDSYQMQKLFRAVIGTNNIDHCART